VRDEFAARYRAMTEGFLALPLKFPGTAVWRAMRGRHYVIAVLKTAARRARAAMRAGGEPACLLDFWARQVNEDCDAADAAGLPHPKYSCDTEMAYTVMDFLFASQDASTASLVWTLTMMAERPDVLARVRAEQLAARPDLGATLTGEAIADMPFTRQVRVCVKGLCGGGAVFGFRGSQRRSGRDSTHPTLNHPLPTHNTCVCCVLCVHANKTQPSTLNPPPQKTNPKGRQGGAALPPARADGAAGRQAPVPPDRRLRRPQGRVHHPRHRLRVPPGLHGR
jgi:hypothetical protein